MIVFYALVLGWDSAQALFENKLKGSTELHSVTGFLSQNSFNNLSACIGELLEAAAVEEIEFELIEPE
jgi:hypothetical protein